MANLGIFLNFNGNCADALKFYSEVFRAEHGMIMRYGDTPGGNQIPGYDDKIMYSDIKIGDQNLMLSDAPPQDSYIIGNNICLNYSSNDIENLKRIFAALSEGGTVLMPQQKTFFSEFYGMVTDKFGIYWNIMV